MSSPSVDAVVVNYNTADELRTILTDDTFRDSFDQVIVVDNDSADDSASVAEASQAELIRVETNRGFGAGANLGIRASSAEFVAVLNPDISIPDRSIVPALIAHFADPMVALVAPALVLPDGSRQDSVRSVPTPIDLFARRRLAPRRGALELDGIVRAPWVVAAFILLRRADVVAVGGFDERFFLYFEDVDLCLRLRQRGRELLLDPRLEVRHHHQKASGASPLSPAFRRHLTSALKFWAKHPATVLPRRRPRQASTAVLAWGAHTSRPLELAAALDAEVRSLGNLGMSGAHTAPVRWLVNALRTLAYLSRRRPRSVIVQNPPIFLALLALVYSRVARARLVLDSHPTAFGRKDQRRWQLLTPLHEFVGRRADAVLVTEDALSSEVESWDTTAIIVHEAPRLGGSAGRESRLTTHAQGALAVLFVAIYAPDEPVLEAVAAAAERSDVHLYVTGDLSRAPAELRERCPENVTLLGYLRGSAYVDALQQADVVLALTTEATSVMRAAYEAVYAGKPLIISDWPAGRETFPYAVYAANDVGGIGAGLDEARSRLPTLQREAEVARREQLARWDRQVLAVRRALG